MCSTVRGSLVFQVFCAIAHDRRSRNPGAARASRLERGGSVETFVVHWQGGSTVSSPKTLLGRPSGEIEGLRAGLERVALAVRGDLGGRWGCPRAAGGVGGGARARCPEAVRRGKDGLRAGLERSARDRCVQRCVDPLCSRDSCAVAHGRGSRNPGTARASRLERGRVCGDVRRALAGWFDDVVTQDALRPPVGGD
jgi:hypothetical protein